MPKHQQRYRELSSRARVISPSRSRVISLIILTRLHARSRAQHTAWRSFRRYHPAAWRRMHESPQLRRCIAPAARHLISIFEESRQSRQREGLALGSLPPLFVLPPFFLSFFPPEDRVRRRVLRALPTLYRHLASSTGGRNTGQDDAMGEGKSERPGER